MAPAPGRSCPGQGNARYQLGGAELGHWDGAGSTDGWSWDEAAPPVRHWQAQPGDTAGWGWHCPGARRDPRPPAAPQGRVVAGQGWQPPPQGTVPIPQPRAPNGPSPSPAEPREGAGGDAGPGQGQARNDNGFPKGIDTLLLLWFNTTPYKTEAAAAILIEGPKLK